MPHARFGRARSGERATAALSVSCGELPAVANRLLWLRDNSVWMANPDMTDPVRVYAAAADEQTWGLTVSRDGKWFAFTSSDPNQLGVKVGTFGGDPPWIVAAGSEGVDQEPSWTPGGELVFLSTRAGTMDLYRTSLAGSDPVRLRARVYDPDVSPDGSKIAYAAVHEGSLDIHVMNIDGTDVVRLTDDERYEGQPRWSPDGERIAFVVGEDRSVGVNDYEIFVMNADGTGRAAVTADDHRNQVPSWSPDGSRILFGTRQLGHSDWDIAWIGVDGTDQVVVEGPPGVNDTEPIWVP